MMKEQGSHVMAGTDQKPVPDRDGHKETVTPIDPATIADTAQPVEHGGPKGPEPTRFGDWERNGRCIDF
ncbi:putative cytosolic protein [Granulibacter bethesdensis CGDNIH1]|uniref:Cytosolic protein n=2 Tax=Granulibacter bethesdensis TaxID=364410 RepID=Q0BVH9_GRABC|nr:putative cytosolic protein [Granulibacter bethesdensis CGDNIH1]APH50950.1 putative cytosolic protein [Granulibacter bethesdensis]APH63645.1 putative cytosolic protein [Granulibacter bethesdensis]